MKTILVFIFLAAVAIGGACGSSERPASQSLPDASNNSSKTQVPDTAKLVAGTNYPAVLYGAIDTDTLSERPPKITVSIRGEDVEMTQSRGFTANLPPVGTTVEMDVMNCRGYLGTAKVTYNGLHHKAWTPELIAETVPSDLEKRIKPCTSDPVRTAPNVFFIAPTDEKRRHLQTDKKPDWTPVLLGIPHEYLKTARLSAQTSKPAEIERCVTLWADSNSDQYPDLLGMCSINEESITEAGNPYEYLRILRYEGSRWQQIWQEVDTKD